MGPRLPTSCAALLFAAAGCAPELKPGTDRADASRLDAAVVDAARDAPPVDAPPVDAPRDAPADAPRARTAQTSCPSERDPGCGLVELAGGTFTMGVADPSSVIDGAPAQPNITVGPYAIDSHEVTIARFRRFWAVAAGLARVSSVSYPGGAVGLAEGPRAPDTTALDPACNWTDSPGAREQHPVNCIDWYTAQAFCAWDGGRLPTDAEWEFAARGREVGGLVAGRRYPWGDEDPLPTCDRARWNQSACPNADGARTRRAGSFAPSPDLEGARLYDMAGNIYEWTADNLVPYDGPDRQGCWGAPPAGRVNPLCNVDPRGARTIRGGSWFFTSVEVLRSASRFGAAMGGSLPLYGVGMRCVRTR